MQNISRIRVGAKAFIPYQGKVLVITEKVIEVGESRLIHDVPGGGVELGETLRETVVREVFEEVGLHVEAEHIVGGWDFVFHKLEENVHIVCVGFQCKLLGSPSIDTTKNPAAYEHILDTKWLTKEEILQSKLFLREDMRQALSQVEVT